MKLKHKSKLIDRLYNLKIGKTISFYRPGVKRRRHGKCKRETNNCTSSENKVVGFIE